MVTDPFRAPGSRNQTGPKVMRQCERKWYVDSSTGFNLGYTFIILGKNIRNTFQYHDMQWTTSYCNFNEHKRTKLESVLLFWVSLDCVCVLNKVVGLKYVLLTGHGSYLVLHSILSTGVLLWSRTVLFLRLLGSVKTAGWEALVENVWCNVW